MSETTSTTMRRSMVRELASLVAARLRCEAAGNEKWLDRHTERLLNLVDDTAPSGSGIDCGTQIDLDSSEGERLVFHVSFHHMDEVGGYDGWTEHLVIVKPSLLCGFDLRITGRSRNGIKEYLADVYGEWLDTDVGGEGQE